MIETSILDLRKRMEKALEITEKTIWACKTDYALDLIDSWISKIWRTDRSFYMEHKDQFKSMKWAIKQQRARIRVEERHANNDIKSGLFANDQL